MGRSGLCIVLGLLAGCQTPGESLSGLSQIIGGAEACAGARAASGVEAAYGGVVRNAKVERKMARIARRLFDGSPSLLELCRCRLLASAKVNAISLPGGRVYVTQGLLGRLVTDDLMAAVLAHEMAHIASKDSLKPRCRNLPQSLRRELLADARAVSYLESAGFRPAALISLVRLIQDVQPDGWVAARISNLSNRCGSTAGVPSESEPKGLSYEVWARLVFPGWMF